MSMKWLKKYNGVLVILSFLVKRRGRKFSGMWKCRLFLLGKHNDDFVPSTAEQARLTRNGLGIMCSHYNIVLYSIL
jgi:hypothetical protein